MIDYKWTEITTTVIHYTVKTPVNWVELDKLLSVVHVAYRDHTGANPSDESIWIESTDESVSICFKKITST